MGYYQFYAFVCRVLASVLVKKHYELGSVSDTILESNTKHFEKNIGNTKIHHENIILDLVFQCKMFSKNIFSIFRCLHVRNSEKDLFTGIVIRQLDENNLW